jgi:signal transduction histidine kinase
MLLMFRRAALPHVLLIGGYLALAWGSKALLDWEFVDLPFWPAAGWATALVFSYGWHLLPSVALAHWLASSCVAPWNCLPPLPAAAIAAGAALQAGCVAYLMRRSGLLQRSLESPGSLLSFLMLIGPLGCWPAALCFLLMSGLGGSAETWPLLPALSWWIGDAIGSLVIVPMALLVVPLHRPFWRERRASLWRPLLALAALPVLSSLAAQNIFRSAALSSAELNALQRVQLLISLNQLLFVFLGVGLLIQSSSWLLTRDRARLQAEAASRVAGSVVHEIAQPLLRLKVQLDRLRAVLVNAQRADPDREIALLDAGVDELARINRISASIQDLTLAGIRDTPTADLSQAIATAVAQSSALIDARDQDLRQQLPSDCIRLSAGQIQLQAVLRNLIANASLAAGEQGVLRLCVSRTSRICRIELHDSGPGFADPAAAGRTPVASTHGGLGLGLTIVRRVVDQANGRLRIERSQQLGGACVCLELPLA